MGYTYDTKSNVYFAADEADEAVRYLTHKAWYWFSTLTANKYLEKVKRAWAAHHGVYYEEAHQVNFGGEAGELVNVAVNHFRNLALHMLNMVTANRPAFRAKASNIDGRSQIQTNLANGILEYYMREKRLEVYLKTAVEYAIVMGSGYIHMGWNSTAGEIYDKIQPEPVLDDNEEPLTNPEGEFTDDQGNVLKPQEIYEGDCEFFNLSVFDVVFDPTKETSKDRDWVLTRRFKNKFDLAAKYPEFANEIKNLQTKSDHERYRWTVSPYDETFDVPVYEFYHRKTESVPEGRYILYLSDDIVLEDSPLPYRKIPIYRISPADILGTPYGYTSMFDILPLQDLYNSLYSTVATNQTAFGVQNVLNPRGNDIQYTQVAQGMNFIEYTPLSNAPNGGRPEPLNLTNTPQEIFNFMGMVERTMETISGVNSVARGNPEASLNSGTALALVQSQALQFMSGLQQSYVMLIEDLGTGLIQLLQDFATVPRVVEIAGIMNKYKATQFTSKDIDKIQRVSVDVGNALSNTTAGRVQMADNLLQYGAIESPEMYMSVINTGRLEPMTANSVNEQMLIQQENERMLEGQGEVAATSIDHHALHIRQHRGVLMDVDARLDPQINARVLAHIQEHIDLLRTTDPDLLALIQEQPLGPQGGSAVNPANAAPQGSQGGIGDSMEQPAQGGALPQPAQPPAAAPDGAPINPTDIPLGQG